MKLRTDFAELHGFNLDSSYLGGQRNVAADIAEIFTGVRPGRLARTKSVLTRTLRNSRYDVNASVQSEGSVLPPGTLSLMVGGDVTAEKDSPLYRATRTVAYLAMQAYIDRAAIDHPRNDGGEPLATGATYSVPRLALTQVVPTIDHADNLVEAYRSQVRIAMWGEYGLALDDTRLASDHDIPDDISPEVRTFLLGQARRVETDRLYAGDSFGKTSELARLRRSYHYHNGVHVTRGLVADDGRTEVIFSAATEPELTPTFPDAAAAIASMYATITLADFVSETGEVSDAALQGARHEVAAGIGVQSLEALKGLWQGALEQDGPVRAAKYVLRNSGAILDLSNI